MIHGIHFASIRLVVIALAVLAQIYLFVHIRQIIKSSLRSDRFKSRAICLVGATIGFLFVLNGYILVRPIPWINPPLAIQLFLFDPPAIWTFGSIFSALFLLFIQLCGKLGQMIIRLYRSVINYQTVSIPANLSRRRFIHTVVGGITTAPLILSGYGAAYASKAYNVEVLTLPFGHPLRVVQLTDIHAGIYMTPKEIRRYVEQVIALQPDVFVLTGDFISNSTSFLPSCLEEMALVHARYGTFATLGNHEHWFGNLNEFQIIFRQYNIHLLQNSHQLIQTERGAFAVVGIDDLRTGHPDLPGALNGLDSVIPTLLLSHRPEIFPQAVTHRIPLTLAGHYHGGQIKLSLPGGDVSLAHLVTPYPEGLYRMNDSYLYVSRGVGTTFTPIRLNAPPEVTLFCLT
jgi:predicted MPP superfamily phosphohydrolase